MIKACCFACLGLLSSISSSALGADYEPPETRALDLTCVAALTSITYEVGHQYLDVELVNNCSKDITAFDLRVTGISGTNTPFSDSISHDYLYLLRWNQSPRPGRFEANDIFRADSRINLRVRDLEGGTAAPAEVQITSVIFADSTTAGDPKAIKRHLTYRLVDLQSLRRVAKAMEGVSDLETARARFRPGSCAQVVESGQAVKARDSLYERLCENVVVFARISTPESFKKFIAIYKQYIDRGILIYAEHTERLQAEDQATKTNR